MPKKKILLICLLAGALTVAIPLQGLGATKLVTIDLGNCLQIGTETDSNVLTCSGSNNVTYDCSVHHYFRSNSNSGNVAEYKDYNGTVREIEEMLSGLGYQVVVDDFYGPSTKLAVMQFQRTENLEPTGAVDQNTYDKLKQAYQEKVNPPENNPAPKPPTPQPNIIAQYQDYNSTVNTIENMLSQLGYNIIVDKYFSYSTKVAVEDFQKSVNLPQTGIVDQATFDKLKAKYAELQSPEPQPEPPAPTPTPQPTPNPDNDNSGSQKIPGLTAEEQQMFDLVNQERTSRGLAPLKIDMDLVKTARMKSQDMVDNNYFAHESPTYGSPFDLMQSQGITYHYAGENLAGAPSVETAHTSLMNSPGHRANILNPNFNYIGIGIVDGGPYGKMFTQHFIGK